MTSPTSSEGSSDPTNYMANKYNTSSSTGNRPSSPDSSHRISYRHNAGMGGHQPGDLSGYGDTSANSSFSFSNDNTSPAQLKLLPHSSRPSAGNYPYSPTAATPHGNGNVGTYTSNSSFDGGANDGPYNLGVQTPHSSSRRPSRTVSSSGRSTGVTALSDKLNPRGNSTGATLPPYLVGASTLVGSPVESNKEDWSSIKGDRRATYAIGADVFSWDTKDGQREDDDDLHDPKDEQAHGGVFSNGFPTRAAANVGVLLLLGVGIIMLFGGYPIIAYYRSTHESTKGGFNLGGTNSSGQVADFGSVRVSLIDPDTPSDALTRTSFVDGSTYNLVFSDEFNTDGRSFYPGDDPFWEAVDLHYWATNNYEWYDPAAVTTYDGALQITLSQHPEHDLNFRGGMIQSWNKFCFTGGYVAVSARMPGSNQVTGLWPAAWIMGNLGRAGYGASLEGNWPYTYEACDVGTLANQTYVNGTPTAVATGGSVGFNKKHGSNALSFLAGQRLSSCTCPGDDHPGPQFSNGSYQGRSAPELDIFEAQVGTVDGEYVMEVSQSAQWAPFNMYYDVTNTTGPAYEFYQGGSFNVYTGEITQQSTSGVTETPQGAVEKDGDGSFAEYGLEYKPGYDDAYVEWVSGGKPSWKLNEAAMDPDTVAEISRRPFPKEPMYIIMNLGISENFGTPEWTELTWPNTMSIDWVRVYQKAGEENVGCDPDDMPTADYINRHMDAYTNANLTLWGGSTDTGGYGQYWPRNRLNPNGCDAEYSTNPGSPTDPLSKAPFRASTVASYWEIPTTTATT